MINWKRNLYLLSLCVFIAQVGFSLTGPFLPMLLLEMGMEENVTVWAGLLFAVNSLTFAFMAPIWGFLSDRYGKRVMLIRSGMGIGITYLLMGFATNHLQLLGLRAFNGLLSGYIPAATMLISTNTSEASLGYALGILQSASAVGAVMGPLVGGIAADLLGVRQSYFLAGGLLIFVALLAGIGSREEKGVRKGRGNFMRDISYLARNSSLMSIPFSLLLVQAALLTIQPTLPLFIGFLVVEERAELMTGTIFSLIGFSMALGAPLINRIRGVDYLSLFYKGLIIGSILSAIQGLVNSIVWLAALRFLFGFVNAAITISGNVLIARSVDKSMRGGAFGLYNGIASIGSVVGPLIGGFLGESAGIRTPFYGSGFLLGMAAAAVLVARAKGKVKITSSQCTSL